MPLRYPAIPQSKPENELQKSIKEAEYLAYLNRLRNKMFFDQELQKCITTDDVLRLTQELEKSTQRHENALKFRESKIWSKYEFYSDSESYPGIPVSVRLDDAEAQNLIEQQNKNQYKVIGSDGTHYTQSEYQNLVESRLESAESEGLQDFESKVVPGKVNLEQTSPSNTQYLYEMAEKSSWKTMMDFQGYVLPGTADPHETCGLWKFRRCPSHNYGKRIIHSCNRLACPTCVKRAGQRIAKKIQRRMWLYRLMIQKTTHLKRNDKPSHVIESIPADDVFWSYSKSKQQRILKEMRKIAGIRGGVSVTHYWRFGEGKLNPYVSIHNHLICYGWIKDASITKKEIYQKFGINAVYHKVTNGTLHTRENVFSVAYYLLSHCAIKNHKHSVHWFGELSYRKIQNSYLKKFRDDEFIHEDEEVMQSKSCKLCGELLVPAKIDKDFKNWQGFLPDQGDMDEGCMFPEGMLLSVDYMEERMVFYKSDYEVVLHKTKRELDEQRRESNPKIYNRITNSSKLEFWW